MSKSNKRVKEELIRLFGPECFIDRLHLRPDTERVYKGKAQYKRMKELTYHHIKEKSKGGQTTLENGALLSAENHIWFNKQSKQDQRRMNNAFQEFKKSFGINCATLEINSEGIDIKPLLPDKEVEIELPPEIEAGVIELEPMTPEEQAKYEEYKRQRLKQQFKKFKYNPALDTRIERPKATIDAEWQQEIFEDNLNEIRW